MTAINKEIELDSLKDYLVDLIYSCQDRDKIKKLIKELDETNR